jgi:hypothetical protein
MMKTIDVTLTTVLAAMIMCQAFAQAPALRPWFPARYHGLVVGTSSREDVLGRLGKPEAVGTEQDTGVPTMTYAVTDPVPGTLIVYPEKGVLKGMTLYPARSLTDRDIVHILGSDFVVVRYDMDGCLGEGGAGPIYQTPNGPIKQMEYRDRSLAAVFAYNDDHKVEAIVFTSKPFGPTHSLCAGRTRKK